MPHVEGHISIAELLGNEQASKVSFGEQGEIKAVESKPLVPPEQQGQQPLKPTKIPTLSEARETTQGGGLLGGIGDFLGSPQGKQTLIGVARGLDPQGVGGQLANVAESQLEGQQFANLTRKLEAGEEITSTDVVGLSPESQQQAAGIISAQGAAKRDQERIDLTAKAVQSATDLRQAQVGEIKLKPEEAQKRDDATLERLEKSLTTGTLDNRETIAARLEIAKIRAGQLDRAIAEREKDRRKISAADIKSLGGFVVATKTFDKIKSASGNFFTDDETQEVLGRLGNTGMTEAELLKITGGKGLSDEERIDLESINRYAGQVNEFKQQADERIGAPPPVGGLGNEFGTQATTIPPEQIPAIDAYLKTKTNSRGEPVSIDDENRLRVLNNPAMRAAAGLK